MKKSTMLAVALVSGSVVSGSQAFAEGSFGKGGQMVFSADRLFGLEFSSVSSESTAGGGKTTDSTTSIALFWPPLSALQSPYQIPHLAFDYIIPGGLTVGGSIGFVSGSGKTKSEPAAGGVSVENDDPTTTILAFAPRVGYALPLTPLFSFWPRGGITYYSIKSERTSGGMVPTTNKTTTSGLGFDLEPMFVLSPADHFGFVAGPVVDIPLSGTTSREQSPPSATPQPDTKVKFLNYGLTIGVLGYF
jgi:hypothetical protein